MYIYRCPPPNGSFKDWSFKDWDIYIYMYIYTYVYIQVPTT